jgi:hypothetical protein
MMPTEATREVGELHVADRHERDLVRETTIAMSRYIAAEGSVSGAVI